MSFRLIVSADFLASQHAPAMCLFTGATVGVEQRPLYILRCTTPGDALARQKSPSEQWAAALRMRQYGIEEAAKKFIHSSWEDRWHMENLVALPHTATGRWHNRLPTLLGIGMGVALVAGILIGITLFLEPDPAAQAMKMGLPPPPPNAPPPPPTAISPLSPGAFVLYGGVGAALLLLSYQRTRFVTVRLTEDWAVILTFPSHREAVYTAYKQAYDQYFALPAPGNLEDLKSTGAIPRSEPADGGDPIETRSGKTDWD